MRLFAANCLFALAIASVLSVPAPLWADVEIVGRYILHPPNGNGRGPSGIAYDSSGIFKQILVTNRLSNTMSIASTAADVVWSVDVGSFATDVAVDLERQRAFVANAGDGTVTVVDSGDWRVLDTVAVGREPVAVAVNQTTHLAYVANQGSSVDPDDTVSVIDTSSYEVVATVSVGGRPGYLAVDEATNLIYAVMALDSRIAVIDGETNAVSFFEGFSIYQADIVLNSDTDDLYVIDYYQNKIARFEMSTRTYSGQLLIGSEIHHMDIDTENNKIYVIDDRWVTKVDLATFTMEDWVEVGYYVSPEEIVVAPDQGHFYVACADSTLRQYRTSDMGFMQREPLGIFPVGVAANGSTGKIYTAVNSAREEPADVYVTAPSSPPNYKLRIPVGPEPEAIAVNPVTNKIYLSHDVDPHEFTVIDGATDQVLTVLDHPAKGIAVNPLTNRIYTIWGSRLTPIDGETDTVLPYTVTRYSAAGYIAVDPELDRVYVSSTYSRGRLMVHDGTTLNEITTLSLGGTDIAVDPINHIVYAGDWDAGVNVIDGATNTLITEIPLSIEARFLAFDPVDRKLYVGDTETDEVVVIDGVTNSVVGSVTVDSGVWDISTDGVHPYAYTANQYAGTVTLLGEPMPVPVHEREALLALYNATGGDNWIANTNWLEGDPCANSWYGVSCNTFAATVTGVELDSNNLSGSIPAAIGDLSNLQILDLGFNQLTGGLPAELGNLTALQFLSLALNQLEGDLPAGLGDLTALQMLSLAGNRFTGNIPYELGGLSALLDLSLEANRLDGPIPSSLGNLTALQTLLLQANRLSGPVPNSLANLTDLTVGGLNISHNGLHSSNPGLDAFLDAKSDHNWSSTQTVAPENVAAASAGGEAATVSWDPIEYTDDTGRYRVMYGQTPGGPYGEGGVTEDKWADSMVVNGLYPHLTYYFVVHAETDSHSGNANEIVSDASQEADATPSYVDETTNFDETIDFLVDPLEGTPFSVLDFNSGFDVTQDAIVTVMDANGLVVGHLVVTSQHASWEDHADDGVFLGMKAHGNFFAQLTIADMTAMPGHAVGLMVRIPPGQSLESGGPGQDWVALGVNGDTGQVQTWSTDDGTTTSTPEGLNVLSAVPSAQLDNPVHLRVERSGGSLTLLYRIGSEALWTEAAASPLTREDFTLDELEAGIYQTSGEEATATIDGFTIRSDSIHLSGFE